MNTKQITNEEFEALLNGYSYSHKAGDIVTGTITSHGNDYVQVDIGGKTNAICHVREAKINPEDDVKNVLKLGEKYDFLITREADEDGCFMLSYRRVTLAKKWQELEAIKAHDAVIEGTVVSLVKGGMLVDVEGVSGFVPTSQISTGEGEIVEGKKVNLKILTLDISQNNFILSSKKANAEVTEDIKKDIFSQIEIGQIVKGEVARLTDFGAFVDIGGVDGLLPLSQISWRWVDKPQDVLKLGDKINVEVISVDYAKRRISLSLKNLEPDPWIEAKGKINEGEKVTGKITRIRHFGAFVEVYPCVEALLPHGELVQYQNKTGIVLDIGDSVETTILRFNADDRRISLTLKETEENS